MYYRKSELDNDNFKWFKNRNNCNTLIGLTISNGQIRGVSNIEVEFNYPFTVVVGENGAGKSTLLSLVACAFHNDTTFFPNNRVSNGKRQRQYYTYGDFFTFSRDELGIKSVEIQAKYLAKDGEKIDIRKKKPSGKWNDFNTRPKRVVTYMGINRLVPPSESGPHKHYKKRFVDSDADYVDDIVLAMNAIFKKNYNKVSLLAHSAYKLFEVERDTYTYSGFNMGAGENAVLGLMEEIFRAGDGALVIIDEIELGLHVQAQKRLINQLKKICLQKHIQIICSTHSINVLESIPPEGRVFLTHNSGSTAIVNGISPELAFGMLSGTCSKELDVFVEDTMGKSFLEGLLPAAIRKRLNIMPVGSDQVVLNHVSVHYRENKDNYITFIDGDKKTEYKSAITTIKRNMECRLRGNEEEFQDYIKKRVFYLPGNAWPERVLVENALEGDDYSFLMDVWDVDCGCVKNSLVHGKNAEKHNEMYEIAQQVSLPKEKVRDDLVHLYKKRKQSDVQELVDAISVLLDELK